PGTTLSYSWDLNGDGNFGDSNSAAPTFLYNQTGAANVTVQLRVTDNGGLSNTVSQVISVNNSPPTPVIDTPQSNFNWQVGQVINFSGHAGDTEQTTIPASALTWTIALEHGSPGNSHEHIVQTIAGVASGSFAAPDHAYPS